MTCLGWDPVHLWWQPRAACARTGVNSDSRSLLMPGVLPTFRWRGPHSRSHVGNIRKRHKLWMPGSHLGPSDLIGLGYSRDTRLFRSSLGDSDMQLNLRARPPSTLAKYSHGRPWLCNPRWKYSHLTLVFEASSTVLPHLCGAELCPLAFICRSRYPQLCPEYLGMRLYLETRPSKGR